MTPQSEPSKLRLHYRAPATEWNEALPLGNGRLGCMIHGRTNKELLQMNEDSVWYGGPKERNPTKALENLPKLRQLIRQGKHREAEDLIATCFFATPSSTRHYEPLGTCQIEFGQAGEPVEDYYRELDLETSKHTVSYRIGGVTHKRETIASFPDNVLATRITASEPICALIRMQRQGDTLEFNDYEDSTEVSGSSFVLHATPGGKGSNPLTIVLSVQCEDADGRVNALSNCLEVKSSLFVVVVAAHTTFRHADPEQKAREEAEAALKLPWDELLGRHQADYQKLFGRTSLTISPDLSHIPTDERIAQHRDAGLAALYHHYGRYLLISSSRNIPKGLPATLQGIWNPHFSPPWGSKYTININLQMNGWPAAPCNLVECVVSVVDLLERMAVRGAKTAKLMYGCGGWCAHHNTDIWGDTAPQDHYMASTLWPLGGVWLVADIMAMLQYQHDQALHKRVAPLLEGCIEFLLDFLVTSEDKQYLLTNPSLSPENTFVQEDGSLGIYCEGSAIDTSLIRMIFEQYVWSHKMLSSETALLPRVLGALGRGSGPKLPDLIINEESGLIQEWGLNNYGESETGHRHVSHLFGLYPACQIDRIKTPELCTAARRVLDRRAAHGGGHTGWSRAWLINLHARLGDAEGCGDHVEKLFSTSTLPSLLDTHPPFQIDGNFGASAGIVECLVQSTVMGDEEGYSSDTYVRIDLLPACPSTWQSGTLGGIHVRGGWEVTFAWKDGQVVSGSVTVSATQDAPLPFSLIFPSGHEHKVSDVTERVYKIDSK